MSIILDSFPEGLSDVSFYPDLFAELAHRDWTDEDLKKLAGLNLIRVFKTVEVVRITHPIYLSKVNGNSTRCFRVTVDVCVQII